MFSISPEYLSFRSGDNVRTLSITNVGDRCWFPNFVVLCSYLVTNLELEKFFGLFHNNISVFLLVL